MKHFENEEANDAENESESGSAVDTKNIVEGVKDRIFREQAQRSEDKMFDVFEKSQVEMSACYEKLCAEMRGPVGSVCVAPTLLE